jgi:carbonic anhydrase
MKIVLKLSLVLSATFFVQANSKIHWGYLGEVAPAHWGDLSKEFKMCKEGKVQSPINIVPTKDVDLKPLEIDYKTSAKSVVNNGHTIQINIKDGSTLKLDGKIYKLKQFHFHVPSENNINGDVFPLEAHFVHQSDDGSLAVVAVMFKEGKENVTLKKIWNHFDKLKEEGQVKCNLSSKDILALIPKDSQYYKFMGSLTTPPCSENVRWQVYKTPLSVSKD